MKDNVFLKQPDPSSTFSVFQIWYENMLTLTIRCCMPLLFVLAQNTHNWNSGDDAAVSFEMYLFLDIVLKFIFII